MIKLTYNSYAYSLDIIFQYDPHALAVLKATFPKREFIDREKIKCWRVPLTTPNIKTLVRQFTEKLPGYKIHLESILETALEVAENWKADNYRLAREEVDYHSAVVDKLLTGALSVSERVAAGYLMRNSKGVLLACPDDMQARRIASAFIQGVNLFPLLVLCRNERVFHWAFEIKKTLGKNVFTGSEDQAIVTMLRDSDKPLAKAEAAVINFGNLEKFLAWARGIAWRCVVIDEANLFQSAQSGQYQAAYTLTREVPHRLLITDTQSKTYPWRMVRQLTLADRLEDMGYSEGEFMKYFCPARGETMHVQHLEELERKLFETCYFEYSGNPFGEESQE